MFNNDVTAWRVLQAGALLNENESVTMSSPMRGMLVSMARQEQQQR